MKSLLKCYKGCARGHKAFKKNEFVKTNITWAIYRKTY